MTLEIKIALDDLSDGKVIALLQKHRQEMLKHSPSESVHALDIDAMKAPNLTFWVASVNGMVAGCGALKQLDNEHAELKSMKVSDEFVGKGVGRALLSFLLTEARKQSYQRLSLETGVMDAFIPARTLYQSVGFIECAPFDDYTYDEHSVCMTLAI